jgi:hypothetical protein
LVEQLSKELKIFQEENSNLRKVHRRQIEAMKQGYEAERPELHETSEQFKSIIEQIKCGLEEESE